MKQFFQFMWWESTATGSLLDKVHKERPFFPSTNVRYTLVWKNNRSYYRGGLKYVMARFNQGKVWTLVSSPNLSEPSLVRWAAAAVSGFASARPHNSPVKLDSVKFGNPTVDQIRWLIESSILPLFLKRVQIFLCIIKTNSGDFQVQERHCRSLKKWRPETV